MSPQAVTLAAFERVEGVDYALSWLVTVTDQAASRRRTRQTPLERGCRRSEFACCLRREERAKSTGACSVGHSNWPRSTREADSSAPLPALSAVERREGRRSGG